MPETAAGRALEPATVHGRYVLTTSRLHVWPAFDANDVSLIEAEARALGRAEALAAVRAAVDGLTGYELRIESEAVKDDSHSGRSFKVPPRTVMLLSPGDSIDRKAVLAAIDNLETPHEQ